MEQVSPSPVVLVVAACPPGTTLRPLFRGAASNALSNTPNAAGPSTAVTVRSLPPTRMVSLFFYFPGLMLLLFLNILFAARTALRHVKLPVCSKMLQETQPQNLWLGQPRAPSPPDQRHYPTSICALLS